MLLSIILSLIFLFFSAFFSGSEIGFISVDKQLLSFKEKQEKNDSKLIKLLYKFVNSYQDVIYISLVGTNISTIASVQILSRTLHHSFKYSYIFLIFIYPIFTLIIAEIIPKLLYSKKPYTLIKFSIIPYSIFYYIFSPIILLFRIIDLLLKKFTKGSFSSENQLSNEQFYSYLKSNFNIYSKKSSTLIDNLVITLENKADDVVNPIDNYNLLIVDKDKKNNIENILNKKIDFEYFLNLLNGEFSIIFHDNILNKKNKNKNIEKMSPINKLYYLLYNYDDYVLIFTKENEFIGYFFNNEEFLINKKIKILKPLIVPFSRKLKNILQDMKTYSKNLVFVVDEYNNIEGLIEKDIIFKKLYESILENTIKTKEIHKVKKNEYIIDCNVEIDKINKILNLKLKSKYYRTLNGYLQEKTGTIPKTGQIIKFGDFDIQVIRATAKEVQLAKIKFYK